MKHILTLSLCFLALSLSAQETITYPYNPDGDADGLVAIPDLQDILAVYGNPFSPAEIMVGDTALSEWIQILSQALQDQQAVIESLTSGAGASGCDFLYPEGYNGEGVTMMLNGSDSYTVPTGKRLYILNTEGSNPEINGINILWYTSKGKPLILNGDDVLSNHFTSSYGIMSGLLVNASTDLEAITLEINVLSDGYEVPIGKKLYLLHFDSNCCKPSINGVSITIPNDKPLILNGGDFLSNPDAASIYNGYIVDEDYFADCGGGGSSEGGGSQDLVVEYVALDASCRCWPDQGEVIVNLPNADIVYLEVEPYLSGQTNSDYDTYNCFRFKLPDGVGYKSMTIIPPHLFSLTPPAGSLGDGMDALDFQIYADNFFGHLNYDGGIDSYAWGPHAGWHTWKFIRDHYSNWRPITTQP